ncbi:MAG: Na/Pi cotransporter family protein [Bacteroidales bacterium]|nr:Na/Pi cotransporter family protein [Bacteroidales bacterium]
MNYSFFDFLRLLGSLALFLYGMKMMSEALQKVAGSRLKNILGIMTSNRFLGLITGFLITTVIQSSSATTVLVVSFVNAGLLSLTESIGVIMGANIGTTVTGWIISILGFSADISALALPAIGVALPLIFNKRNTWHNVGELIVGIALLFMGLDFLKASVPNINESPEILAFLQNYTSGGYASIFLFLFIGTVLTVVIQSSSATMALTFVMCSQGWIPFEMAAAMVMGENIGTTVTANIAASVGNVSARRAAMVHMVFNLLGICWLLIVFYPFTDLVDSVVMGMSGTSPRVDVEQVPLALAVFHTIFNLSNAFIFIWFTKLIERIVMRVLPAKPDTEEEFHLRFISTGMLSTSELSQIQAKKEITLFAEHTHKMFGMVRQLLDEQLSSSDFEKSYEKIKKYEDLSDNVEVEIANYLTKVNQGKLSDVGRRRNKAMLKIVGEIESVGDANFSIARLINRVRTQNLTMPPVIKEKLFMMLDLVDRSLDVMDRNLSSDDFKCDLNRAQECEADINAFRNQEKMQNFERVKNGEYPYEMGVYFTDMLQECEELGDYVINVTEALAEV